jgi:hypothetical protein
MSGFGAMPIASRLLVSSVIVLFFKISALMVAIAAARPAQGCLGLANGMERSAVARRRCNESASRVFGSRPHTSFQKLPVIAHQVGD